MSIIFTRYVNDPTTSEQELHVRSGQAVTVIEQVHPSRVDAEVGPMYLIRFADGFQAEAFADELRNDRFEAVQARFQAGEITLGEAFEILGGVA